MKQNSRIWKETLFPAVAIICGNALLAFLVAAFVIPHGIIMGGTTGIAIVRRAIEEPLRQIVANAGGEGSVVVNKIKEGKGSFGYNARSDRYEDMFEAGIIDPTKVARVALENAASIASMFLTTECVLAEKKEENPAPAMPAGGMGY